MNAEDSARSEHIAAYLKAHPEFFEQYAEMISEITIPHPHGGRTIPISERQILTLREKNKALDSKLREIIQFGEENDIVSEKIHKFSLALLRARDVAAVLHIATRHLKEDFAVPYLVMRVWRKSARVSAEQAEFSPVSDATRALAATFTAPSCSAEPLADTATLFGDAAPALNSYAYIPLRDGVADGETFGLLALASEAPRRYYAGMGTVYLSRLGELIASALLAHLAAA